MRSRIQRALFLYCTCCMLLCSCNQVSSPGFPTESGELPVPVTGAPSDSEAPTGTPTMIPAAKPTTAPTDVPSATPSEQPTAEPTDVPSATPTEQPTAEPTDVPSTTPTEQPTVEPTDVPSATPIEQPTVGQRDNTPYCPLPEAPGTLLVGNDVTQIDYSHQSDGYIMARYFGGCPKVKLILTGPNSYKCTFDLNTSQFVAFPLTAGNGVYSVGIYENIEGNTYATAYTCDINVSLSNLFSTYLRPNQYVDYNSGTYAVALSSQLCAGASNDLDCVNAIYNYIITTIKYDHDKAANALNGSLSGYLPQIDGSLQSQKGICVDYAAIMTCMLRSQRIPTRLEVGYAGGAYHAWISTYITDVGWVNGIIHFDGNNWQLIDPTFGASTDEDDLREFIGTGSNYTVKYIY